MMTVQITGPGDDREVTMANAAQGHPRLASDGIERPQHDHSFQLESPSNGSSGIIMGNVNGAASIVMSG
jgi:3-deoxy-D-arabino-heptulosonate 7-phosphate (DAHP) synthase